MKLLTEQQFHDTFTDTMQEIDFDSSLLEVEFTSDQISMAVPHSAFRNALNTFEHHLLETEADGVYLIFVKELATGGVDYHILNVHEAAQGGGGGCCGGSCGCGC